MKIYKKIKENKKMKILITVGLPASGKTTFSKKYIEENSDKKVKHIDIDEYRETNYKSISVENIYLNSVHKCEDYDALIIDGLFLSNRDVSLLINMVKNNTVREDLDFEIHYWNPDIEACLHNDKGRRKENSVYTIKNALIEKINKGYILKHTDEREISVVYHNIERKPFKNVVMDEIGLQLNDNYLYSEPWVARGVMRNCWGDRSELDVESSKEFKELDKLLMAIVPNITYLEYKELFSELVEIQEYDDYDYYCHKECQRWKCNVDNLLEYLEDKGLL